MRSYSAFYISNILQRKSYSVRETHEYFRDYKRKIKYILNITITCKMTIF